MSKLNCTSGNYQCGSICQPESKKCYSNLSAEDNAIANQLAGLVASQAKPEAIRSKISELTGGQKVPQLKTIQKWQNDLPEADAAAVVDDYVNFWGEKLGLKPIGDKPADKMASLLLGAVLGAGQYGEVRDNGDGTVTKRAKADQRQKGSYVEEAKLQKYAADAGVAPEVLDAGPDYIRMQKLDGYKLGDDTDDYFTPGYEDALAKALLTLHTKANVRHGDLHTGNVAYGKDGDVKLMDFGMATHDPGEFGGFELDAQNFSMLAQEEQETPATQLLRSYADGELSHKEYIAKAKAILAKEPKQAKPIDGNYADLYKQYIALPWSDPKRAGIAESLKQLSQNMTPAEIDAARAQAKYS